MPVGSSRYTTTKKIETAVKGVASGKDTISCVDPKRYAKRFLKFMQHEVVETGCE